MAVESYWDREKAKGSSLTPEMQRQARGNVRAALMRARLLMPYTAALIDKLQPIASEKVPTLAVSPDLYLIYNPFFFKDYEGKMGRWEFGVTFLHESLHVIFKHFSRWDEYKKKLIRKGETPSAKRWNLAGDVEINSGLVGIKPVNKVLSRMIGATLMEIRAGEHGWDLTYADNEKQRAAARRIGKAEWAALPEAEKYPRGITDWPKGPISLPRWFWFADMLRPPQKPGRRAEFYYPFVPKDGKPGEVYPPPQRKPPWKGYKNGDRVVIKATNEEGVIVEAGPYDPNADPPQKFKVIVTNYVTESARSVKHAKIAAAVAKAKKDAGLRPCGCPEGDEECLHDCNSPAFTVPATTSAPKSRAPSTPTQTSSAADDPQGMEWD